MSKLQRWLAKGKKTSPHHLATQSEIALYFFLLLMSTSGKKTAVSFREDHMNIYLCLLG